jgi:hypothetical protein
MTEVKARLKKQADINPLIKLGKPITHFTKL